jgi:hypothetical protein
MANAFKDKWKGRKVYEKLITNYDLNRIDKLKELYKGYTQWEWRYGHTPDF